MAAELEKLAAELAARGYTTAARHFQQEAVDYRRQGLIPASLTEPERAETSR